ncbi:MAG: helix-turn-helix domain-containing protein [Novosphingobium sp.]
MQASAIAHYPLYGEPGVMVPPEFVHLERIFDRSSLHDWTIEPHAHPHMLQLLFVESGASLLRGDGGDEHVHAPALILVPPSSVHAFRFDRGAEGWVLSLAAGLLSDPRLGGVLGGLSAFGRQARAVTLMASSAAATRLSWLLADMAGRLGAEAALGSGLLAQLALILAEAAEATETAASRGPQDARDPLVARFRALVEAHYREHWPVSAYAKALGTTPSTLTRATRALTGQPPADLVHDRLVLEARRNLTFTGAGVAQIAYALGFADPAYFARFFKARTGFTARAFREQRAWTGTDLPDTSNS